jgi:hypothetical protein
MKERTREKGSGERGNAPQARMKKRKEKGRERRRRDLLEGENRRGERETDGEGGEKGEKRGRKGGGDTEREETRISSAEAATPTRAGAAEEAAGGA